MQEKVLVGELILRFILFVVFTITDNAAPYHRVLQPEEMWLYRYPHSADYYPGRLMWITVISVPMVVLLAFYIVRKDKEDFIQAALGVTMSLFVAGCITNFIKLAVGRPRPDFLSRCYPEGIPDHDIVTDTRKCSGREESVLQGLKSFPSGHSSMSFSSLGFVSLYIGGKLQVFHQGGRGVGWRFIVFLLPLLWSLMIAVSRTSDYHHHWQDVTVGAILGLVVCYTCYRQVYPALNKVNSHLCYTQINRVIDYQLAHRSEPVTPSTTPITTRDTQFKFDAKII
ncbi:phospholipid phosphatase 5-like [Babylonia areolata]|uniref:phospholipid phosphatase 5-like n=1 Tax=Babylonia areolata TaxID=304850 RepID=UPI003FCF9212